MKRNFARVPSTINAPPLITTSQKNLAYRRLLVEAQNLLENPIPGCDASFRNDDPMIWTLVIEGPVGSFYEGGNFFVQLRFNDEYPHIAPVLIFLTRIYHCNIDSEGRISLPLINSNWSPCKGVADIMRALQQLMRQCNPHQPVLFELAEQCLNEPKKYEVMAREWSRRYAH